MGSPRETGEKTDVFSVYLLAAEFVVYRWLGCAMTPRREQSGPKVSEAVL